MSQSTRAGDRVRSYVITPVRNFLRTEASGGIVLLAAMIAALVWANGPFAHSYQEVWEGTRVGISIGDLHLEESLHAWINDGLMVFFFFVVGLEIKREMVIGELRDPRAAALPVIGAVGGMIGPAAIYWAFNMGTEAGHGWGVPVATDIAFAVGVLALLGKRAPTGLKIFLLTLAIADDIGGIAIIAVFYSSGLDATWGAVALGALAATVVLRRLGAVSPWIYVPFGVLAWFATFESGVHPTIAGVALGLLTPARPVRGRPVLEELEHRLHPFSSYVIIPIFALSNAGVVLNAESFAEALGSTVFWGVAGGLLVGKVVGISAATWATVALKIGKLPTGVGAWHVVGVSALAGIGFTVALFITGLAFVRPEFIAAAKVGVLVGSVLAAAVGACVLLAVPVKREDVAASSPAAPPAR